MTLDLIPIRERLAAATPGPWRQNGGSIRVADSNKLWLSLHPSVTTFGPSPDKVDLTYPVADLVANAPTDIAALVAEVEKLREALTAIRDLRPAEFAFPEDWEKQVSDCPECQRYKNHPVQRGICNTHMRPLWDREAFDKDQPRVLGYRAQGIARDALCSLDAQS